MHDKQLASVGKVGDMNSWGTHISSCGHCVVLRGVSSSLSILLRGVGSLSRHDTRLELGLIYPVENHATIELDEPYRETDSSPGAKAGSRTSISTDI